MTAEKKIISGCKKGNRKAQKALFDKYSSTLFGICMRYSGNRMEAEDILHDGMIMIYTKINSYSGTGSFEGWLKRVMVNCALQHIRENSKNIILNDFDTIDETQVNNYDSDEEYVENEQADFSKEEILKAMHELPKGYQTVLNLFVFENYKHQEIAEELNISVNTSRTQLRKARIAIKKILLKEDKKDNIKLYEQEKTY